MTDDVPARPALPAGSSPSESTPSAPTFDLGAEYDLDGGALRRRRELREAAELSGELFTEVTELVQGVHTAIARRVFRYVGPQAAPVRVAHSTISGGVYAAVKAGGLGLAKIAGYALASRDVPPPSTTRTGGIVIGAVNGILGSDLEQRNSPLTVRMSLRADGGPVPPTAAGLARAYPDATGTLVVFAHGLCETEDAWALRATQHYGDPASTHGARLRRDLGLSPVYLRYNTGRHISDNGRDLAALLEEVVLHWPVPVQDIVLVGHSMGGLVIRSACHTAKEGGLRWVQRVRHLLYLGSPHYGAPLAQLVHVGSWGMSKVPETAPVATLLNRRSFGVRDLRYGTIVEADWKDLNPDALRGGRPSEIPLMPEASHYYIGATITRDKSHPLGRLLGDVLVQFPSASGSTRRSKLEFELDNGRHLGGLNHMDLLNHPLVYEHIRTWLAVAPQDVEAAVAATADLPDVDAQPRVQETKPQEPETQETKTPETKTPAKKAPAKKTPAKRAPAKKAQPKARKAPAEKPEHSTKSQAKKAPAKRRSPGGKS